MEKNSSVNAPNLELWLHLYQQQGKHSSSYQSMVRSTPHNGSVTDAMRKSLAPKTDARAAKVGRGVLDLILGKVKSFLNLGCAMDARNKTMGIK